MSPEPSPPEAKTDRLARWAPLVAGLLVAAPVLVATYPPASDLPYHESEVSIMRHIGDRSMFPAGLYAFNFGHPNQLFHVAALALSFVFATPLACRIVIAAAMVGVALGAGRLADHLGASRWVAALCAPIAIGWLLFMGLVANIVGLGLLLALLPTADRFVAAPSARGALKVAAACVALYFGHEAMMFVFVGAFLLFALLARDHRPRDVALRLAPAAFAVALTFAQLAWQKRIITMPGQPDTRFMPLGLKLGGTPSVAFSNYDTTGARVLFFLLVGTMALLVAERWSRRGGERLSWVAALHRHRFELVAGCCAVAFVAFPATLGTSTYVYHRFLAPTLAVAAVSCAPRGPFVIRRLTRVLCGVFPLAALLVLWPAFVESSRNYDDLESLLPLIDKQSAVATISTPPNYTGYVRSSLGVRAVTERGGRMLYSFVESPIAPVRFTREHEWINPVERVESDEHEFCPPWDLTRFKYVLLSAPDMELQHLVTIALRPEATLVATRGEWALFKSNLDVVSIEAPDAKAPAWCIKDTIGARVDRAFVEVKARVDVLRGAAAKQGTP